MSAFLDYFLEGLLKLLVLDKEKHFWNSSQILIVPVARRTDVVVQVWICCQKIFDFAAMI